MAQQDIANKLRDWVVEINREMGWNGIVTEEGVCGFGTPEGLEIFVEATEEAVLFTVAVASAENASPELLRALLIANHRSMQTGPAHLSLSPLSNDIVLNYLWSVAEQASAGQFATLLGGFTQIAQHLQKGLDDGSLREWAKGFQGDNNPGQLPPGMGMRV